MSKANLFRLLSLIAVFGLISLLFVAGAHPAAGSLFASPWDKLAHVGFYFVLYLLVKDSLNVSSWLVAPLVFLIAVADEYHQISLPYRHAGWDDLIADFFGIIYGVIFRRALVINP